MTFKRMHEEMSRANVASRPYVFWRETAVQRFRNFKKKEQESRCLSQWYAIALRFHCTRNSINFARCKSSSLVREHGCHPIAHDFLKAVHRIGPTSARAASMQRTART